ncbi:MAG: hypothetical protein O3B86_17120 [Planctomycetota bacterium]|nr:hypothetical protein [Planctomycetota bacterium]
MQTFIARLLGRENVDSIDSVAMSFGADWAHNGPAWLLFGWLGLAFVSAWFYLKYQQRASRSRRVLLGFLRGTLLCLLLLILADPIIEVAFSLHPRPVVWLLLDGTDSMNIIDRLTDEEVERLKSTIDLTAATATVGDGRQVASNPEEQGTSDPGPVFPAKPFANEITREAQIKSWLTSDGNPLGELAERFRIEVFQFRRPDEVSAIALSTDEAAESEVDPQHIAGQYKADGPVTSLGAAFNELRRRHTATGLTAVVAISDFDQNSGVSPIEAARRLNVPVFTIGVGATHAVDLAVDLQTSLKMKKAETSNVTVTLRQQELDGVQVAVRVTARPMESGSDRVSGQTIPVGERSVQLSGPSTVLEFPFTPVDAGRFMFIAEVDPVDGETVELNNRAEREVTVIDDFLRLLFVEYEPAWEWRFVKEVFHRDKLVGLRGFRTYLRSSDPIVRETNELFVPTLTLPRNEFFEYDVIFLGDMPASSLSTRFGEMVKEFVGKFGGGLVVMAGPRFGPGELASTPIAGMLPVIVDPDGQFRDDHEFELQLTPLASSFDFMRLGESDVENAKGWKNLGNQPWYQPVRRVESSATTVLAEHPRDTCVDGRTPQPLIAIRRYGRGEVIYLAHNEMWRLRRKYGETYYRQFWGQMIHRLGLSHALGSQKRFVVRADRQQYQPDQTALITVEAFDENFEPLTGDMLDERHLTGEVWLPGRSTEAPGETRPITLAEYRPGVFETRVPVSEAGNYVVRVNDPVSLEPVDVYFQVADLSVERRSATRNRSLQESIAAETGGRSSELYNAREMLAKFDPPRMTETTVEVIPLWSTWLTFGLVIGMMFVEWLVRKFANLT